MSLQKIEQPKNEEPEILQIIPAAFPKFVKYKCEDGSFYFEKVVCLALVRYKDGTFIQPQIFSYDGIEPAYNAEFIGYFDECE